MTDRLHDVEHAVVRVLARAETLDRAYAEILQGICGALDWRVGALWLVDGSTPEEMLRCAEVWRGEDHALDGLEQTSRTISFRRGIGLPGRIWETGRPAWTEVDTGDFPRAKVAADAGLHGVLGFPIVVNGDFFGVMEFFTDRIQEPDPVLLEMLYGIGSQIGNFVECGQMGRRLVLHAALLESQGEATIDGILIVSTDNHILYWNKRFMDIWNVPEELLRSGEAHRVVERKAQLTSDPQRYARESLALLDDPETPRRDEILLIDGRVIDRWTAPVRGADGTLYGRVLYYRDVTGWKRTEERLRENERWSSFLAEVSTVMSQTLDYRANLNRLAEMAVPMLADWCAVHIVDETGEITPVALVHEHGDGPSDAKRMQELFPIESGAEVGLSAAVRTGSSMLFEEMTDELLQVATRDEEHLEQVKSLGLRSAMIVPLVCRDRVLGTLSLFSAESGRRYTKEDLRLAEDLAARAAFPLDNARLYQERARVARTLQDSLLPPDLPDINGVELAARYRPVSPMADVGGDFYDVFAAGARTWGVVLGDVSGKGVEAAAVTSLARHTLRTATMATQRPSEILSMLNAALLDQTERDRFCTAVYALIEPRFGRVKLTVSCGGHPLPYVVRSNGTLEPIACEGTLLGVVSDPELNEVSVEMDFGDKLVLYTDGILDVRPNDPRFGQQHLEELLAACSKRGVKAAADLIERSILELQSGQARDDFALVILGVRASIFRRATSPSLWRREPE